MKLEEVHALVEGVSDFGCLRRCKHRSRALGLREGSEDQVICLLIERLRQCLHEN